MSYNFWLYRAAPGLDGPHTWDHEHREPLGDPDDLRVRIAARFPALIWTRHGDGGWRAHGPHDEDDAGLPAEVWVTDDDPVLFVTAYGWPRALRGVMDAIGANYCWAVEEMALRDVHAFDDDWTTRVR